MSSPTARFVVFEVNRRIAAGDLAEVAAAAWRETRANETATPLAFDMVTGDVVDLDLRGTEQDVTARYAQSEPGEAKRGRPRLGIVSREVTLLPRHWDWLARQPGGASAAIRRLIEFARKDEANVASSRIDPTYRFMSAIGGDLPGFEEAARALFARDQPRLEQFISSWPTDIHRQVLESLGSGIAGRDVS
jgi:uncharacterized protein